MQAERELHIQVPFVRMLPQCALCPHCSYTLFIIYKRVVLEIMSRRFSLFFRVCFCKLKKEHSGLCD